MTENTQTPLIDPTIVGGQVVTPVEVTSSKKSTPDKGGFIWGVGRRKSSVARVRIKPGKGGLKINEKELSEYFRLVQDQEAVLAPLKKCDAVSSFDIFVNVNGGGTTGQAGAVLLGIARAMVNYDEASFSRTLRDAGLLTRDGRMKERKKPGQRGARRKYQFSKR